MENNKRAVLRKKGKSIMSNEIIIVKQLPIIQEQLQKIKVDVTDKVNMALSLVCTPETVKTVKDIRAELTKDFNWWEDKRKEVKNAIMKPYNDFEAVYKENITDIFKNADTELKDKIDSVENELKEKKRAKIKEYFNEYLVSKNIDFLTFEMANINITLSVSEKKLKEQSKAFIDRVCDDLNLIDTQEHKDEILYHYKKIDGGVFLNASRTITLVNEKYKTIEEEKAKEEERKAKERAIKEAAAKVEKITPPTVEPITPPTVEESDPVLTLVFKVTATKSKLRILKEFLNEKGYECE